MPVCIPPPPFASWRCSVMHGRRSRHCEDEEHEVCEKATNVPMWVRLVLALVLSADHRVVVDKGGSPLLIVVGLCIGGVLLKWQPLHPLEPPFHLSVMHLHLAARLLVTLGQTPGYAAVATQFGYRPPCWGVTFAYAVRLAGLFAPEACPIRIGDRHQLVTALPEPEVCAAHDRAALDALYLPCAVPLFQFV